ncbi:MAG: hypothetical protein [Podoviridae sp. ctviO18]|nr:MAG: hypothetical protein [Podoviridae sp. ctviO18]
MWSLIIRGITFLSVCYSGNTGASGDIDDARTDQTKVINNLGIVRNLTALYNRIMKNEIKKNPAAVALGRRTLEKFGKEHYRKMAKLSAEKRKALRVPKNGGGLK